MVRKYEELLQQNDSTTLHEKVPYIMTQDIELNNINGDREDEDLFDGLMGLGDEEAGGDNFHQRKSPSHAISVFIYSMIMAIPLLLFLALIMFFLVPMRRDVVGGKVVGNGENHAVPPPPPPRFKNVIFMISDGLGPAMHTAARVYHERLHSFDPTIFSHATNWDETTRQLLPLDLILRGAVKTRSADSLVTDSAASATAYACAIKTLNLAIGVDVEGIPCGTVLESAHLKGYKTGLVATSRITHATPAAFSSHVPSRQMEDEIARQQIHGLRADKVGSVVDLLMGGGRCHFLPKFFTTNATGTVQGCRQDGRNLIQEAEQQGWTLLNDRSGFDRLHQQFPSFDSSFNATSPPFPLLALFSSDHMSYEIDRVPSVEPSLAEMTQLSLSLMDAALRGEGGANAASTPPNSSTATTPGFFIMIEGSRIDMAEHANDAKTGIVETLSYEDAVLVAINYTLTHPDTLLISTSDHETGGMALGVSASGYKWMPERLAWQNRSLEVIAREIIREGSTSLVPHLLGVQVGGNVPDALPAQWNITGRVDGLSSTAAPDFHFTPTRAAIDILQTAIDAQNADAVAVILATWVAANAGIGWSTGGHTGVDVALYLARTGDDIQWPGGWVSEGGAERVGLTWSSWHNSSVTFDALPSMSTLFQGAGILARGGGAVENVEVGRLMSSFLNLNLSDVTRLLAS